MYENTTLVENATVIGNINVAFFNSISGSI